jgi:Fe-coproporphyrin III synthase
MKKLKILFSLIKSIRSLKKSYKNNFQTQPQPFSMHFETTYNCTCKCVFCQRWKDGPKNIKKELTYNQIEKMINQAYDLGVRFIALSGGEPLLKKDILKAMKYARKKGIFTSMTHNGTLINEKNVKNILSSFDAISISLDSLNPEKNDKLRGVKGVHKKTINTLKLLKKYSKHTVIDVQSVLTSENFKDILEINKKLTKKGISTLFQPIHDDLDNDFKLKDKKFKDIKTTKKEWKQFIKAYKYTHPILKLMFKKHHAKALDFILHPKSTKKEYTCFAGSFSFFINPYGEVYPCDPIRKSMGNIKKQTLKEIWHNKNNIKLRKQIKNRKCHCWLLCSSPFFINLSRFISSS